MRKRWRGWMLAGIASSASLVQLGCMSRLINEIDLFTSPSSVDALYFVPRSNFFDLFLNVWRVFGVAG